MEMVLFIGVPASGKSSFYKERFFLSHVRINRDMLKTRRREELLIRACFDGKTKFVVENTNLTRVVRAPYIALAKNAEFRVVGYFFDLPAPEAVNRNKARPEPERVPAVAIWAARKRLEPPTLDEGFDELHTVTFDSTGTKSIQTRIL
ncbi:MAG TPA: AAA family ATPase [Verrucomicrobiae bacterium]|nr:AAA family ATPase [Verrucomicrobiae bacterium]